MAAKLPDATVLGAARFSTSGVTPSADASGIGRGQAIAGRALESAGRAIASVGSAIDSVNAANEKMDFLKAESQWNVGKIEESTKFDGDQKYEDLPQRYEQSLRERRDGIAAGITNPRAREIFTLKTEDDIARGKVAAVGTARKLEADANLGFLDQQQEQVINTLVAEQDPAKRAEMITSHRAWIRSYAEKGWLNQQQVFDRDTKFKNTFAVADAEARSRRGDTDGVISELEAAALNSAFAPAPLKPPSRQPISIKDKSSDAGFGTRFGTFAPGEVKGMVIHHTAGEGNVDGVISTFKQRNFPAQFVIERDGTVYQTLPDGARGQHVRNGWGPKGEGYGNANLEGVEIIAKNDKDVTPAQKAAAIQLVEQRAQRWGYDPKTGVFGHGELNPGHKEHDEGMTVVSAIRGGEKAGVQTADAPNRAQRAMEFFVNKGLSREQAAGLVGNLKQEAYDLDPDTSHDGGKGVGIAGWNGERRAQLRSFAGNEKDFDKQLEFMWEELNGPERKALEAIRATGDAKSAAVAAQGYFRPGNPMTERRVAYADEMLAAGKPQDPGKSVKVASTDPNFVPGSGDGGVPVPPQKPTLEAAAVTAQRAPTVYDAMGALERERLLKHMYEVRDRQKREAASETLKASAQRGEEYERKMLDASVGKGELPAREDIEADPALNDTHKNTVLRQWGQYAKDTLSFKSAFERFNNNQPFNPYDKEDRKNADRLFQGMKGDDAALTAVIQRTGILPESAATKMRADLISNDPKRVVGAMSRAANAISINQNVMTGFDGADDLEKQAVKFRTYVDDFGMSAEEAAGRMIREQTPEFKAGVNAKIKSEDINELIKKKVSINDLSGQFDDSILGFKPNPQVGFSARTRDVMFDQYATLVKEHYLDSASGDLSTAKKLAANDLKKSWGVSEVNGSKIVMQYPPERAPAYHGLENASGLIAKEAVKAIKEEAGQDVDAKSIRIVPIPGVTAQAYKSGQVPPYALSWEDKNGILHMLKPGRAFVADPSSMRQQQTLEREGKFNEGREAAGAERMIAPDQRMPFGVPQ